MLTLYEHPLSAYAMKAKIGLLEKGLEFQAIVPDGMAKMSRPGLVLFSFGQTAAFLRTSIAQSCSIILASFAL